MVLAVVAGCQRSHDSRLSRVQQLCDHEPEAALSMLDSIDYSSLSRSDRYFYDFLHLKACDKAYIFHTSDSIILRLLDYYDGDRELGSEVLYYGGRVYSDLGDYPTSLSYFQKALEATPAKTNPELRSRILSQTGRLLNDINLYKEAIPYLKECLTLDSLLCDTFSLAYDHGLLASILMKRYDFDSANYFTDKAIQWANLLNNEDIAFMKAQKAEILYYLGLYDESLNLIRGLPEQIEPEFRNAAQICASDCYLIAEKKDSAFYYAMEVINGQPCSNTLYGYNRILRGELYDLIPAESLKLYTQKYSNIIFDDYNKRESKQTLIQHSLFNYKMQEIRRITAENEKNRLQFALYICAFLIVIFIFIIQHKRICHHKRVIKLQVALDSLRSETAKKWEASIMDNIEVNSSKEIEDKLRERLRSELLSKNQNCSNAPVNSIILNSESYKKVKCLVETNRCLIDNDSVWMDLEHIMLSVNPNFKQHLQLLAGKALNKSEWHILLLIKCGFTPTEMQILLSRTKGTISKRRVLLSKKILGKELSTRDFDNIIRLL